MPIKPPDLIMATNTTIVLSDFKDFSANVLKQLTVEITADLIKTTPVDTGWARSNWIPSFGESFTGTDGTRESVVTSRQQSGLTDVLTNYAISKGNIYISNNVPYILLLNDGSSRQAPAGFVQQSIARAISQVFSRRSGFRSTDRVI